ncbi:MAG: S-layer protein, partial [Cyanobacteria bacterium J06607_17]
MGNSLEKNLEPDPQLVEEETADDDIASVPDGVATPEPVVEEPEPSEDETESPDQAESPAIPTFTQPSYTDIGEAPEELQQHIEDLVALDLLM